MSPIPEITFFMIVTEPSVPIADFCIRSYKKLKRSNFSFELVVYGNCISPQTWTRHFEKWGRLDYVRLMDNNAYLSDSYPIAGERIVTPEGILRPLEGPFELGATIWTRELPRIQSPFIATVDSDFEIFCPDFIEQAHRMLNEDSTLAGVSTDYSPDNPHFHNTYLNTTHFLRRRWHTWFCLYRKECLQGNISHHMFIEKEADKEIGLKMYDDAAFLQEKLIQRGWKFDVLPESYLRQYLHYVAFSKNTMINSNNIRLYHRYMTWMRRGLIPRLGFEAAKGRLNRWWGYFIHELYVRRFGGVNQSREQFNFMGLNSNNARFLFFDQPSIVSERKDNYR